MIRKHNLVYHKLRERVEIRVLVVVVRAAVTVLAAATVATAAVAAEPEAAAVAAEVEVVGMVDSGGNACTRRGLRAAARAGVCSL